MSLSYYILYNLLKMNFVSLQIGPVILRAYKPAKCQVQHFGI